MRTWGGAVALAFVLCGGQAAAQEGADLSGTWQLNVASSDAGGIAVERDGPRGGRVPVGGFGLPGRAPMGATGPSGMPPPGRMGDPQEMERRLALVRELVRPIRRLTIAQDGSFVSITDDDGRTTRYRTNGKAEKHQALNGVVETETRWKKRTLVRKTNLDDGTGVEETFEVLQKAKDGIAPGALVVTVKLHGGLGRRKPVRRVYDAVDAPAARP